MMSCYGAGALSPSLMGMEALNLDELTVVDLPEST
jgi:hypothetical protein